MSGRFSCEHCSKKYDYDSILKKHMRIHTGEKPYFCDVEDCLQRFSQMSNLLRHRKVHLGIKPFECPKCQKNFSSVSNLNQHMMIHDRRASRSKFVCFVEGCDQSYFYICTLKNHIVKFHHSEFSRIEDEYKNRSFIDIYKFLTAKKNGLTNGSLNEDSFYKEMPENCEKIANLDNDDPERKERSKLSRNLFKILKFPQEPTNENSKVAFSEKKNEVEKLNEEKSHPQNVTNFAIIPMNTKNSLDSNQSSENINQNNLIKKISTMPNRLIEIQIINLTFNFLLHNFTIFNEFSKISELTKLHSLYHYNALLQNHEQNKAIVAILYLELAQILGRGQKISCEDLNLEKNKIDSLFLQ